MASRPSRPVTVAVTGGIGAGKSEALAAFGRRGAETVSADELVHTLYRDDADVRAALLERWGERVFRGPDVDRAAIAQIVFADPDELSWLEALLHPKVVEAQARWLGELAGRDDPPAVAVAEIPLLYETGGEQRFDAVVVVTAPEEVRASRARVPLADRSRRLLPDDEKARRADFVYVNDGGLEELDAFVADVLARVERR